MFTASKRTYYTSLKSSHVRTFNSSHKQFNTKEIGEQEKAAYVVGDRFIYESKIFDCRPKRFDNKPFKNAVCKQTYWDKLPMSEKYDHYLHSCCYGITITGKDFSQLVGKCDIVVGKCDIVVGDSDMVKKKSTIKSNKDVTDIAKSQPLVGSIIEDSINGVRFSPIGGIAVNKGTTIYYMTIPEDCKITITGDSLIREYRSTKLIVKDIYTSNKNHVSEICRDLVSQMPVRDHNGCVNGSVY
jgi:hypothetical protein